MSSEEGYLHDKGEDVLYNRYSFYKPSEQHGAETINIKLISSLYQDIKFNITEIIITNDLSISVSQ